MQPFERGFEGLFLVHARCQQTVVLVIQMAGQLIDDFSLSGWRKVRARQALCDFFFPVRILRHSPTPQCDLWLPQIPAILAAVRSARRSGSRQCGAACSTGIPWASCSSACWRANQRYAAPGTHQAGSTVRVTPQTLHLPRRSKIQSCKPSCACLRRRPWPMMAIRPQTGHCRGSHSASYPPGLHPSPERGIKTITGAKACPGIATHQGT